MGSNNLVINKLGSNNSVLVLIQESMEYMLINVFGLRRICKELEGFVKLRFFRLVTMMLQCLKEDWRTNTDYLVKQQDKLHLVIKVGENIMVTRVSGQEGGKSNVVKKEEKEGFYGN
ncbi:hypothetical protein Tco_0757310 [Tanacetum coccineum]